MNLPQTMRDINIYIDGLGHLGTSKKIDLPKIEFGRESKKAGGFERQVVTGSFKEMSAEIELDEYNGVIFSALSRSFKDDAHIVVKGSIFQNGKSIPASVTLKGSIDTDLGSWEADSAINPKITMKPTRYILEIGGKEYLNIDMHIPQAVIDGVDYLAELKAHIS